MRNGGTRWTEELKALEKHGTWEVVPRPKGVKPITSKWVYKIKLDSNNQPVRFKARLVARGFEQKEGIDYEETFAPVVKLKSLKILLAIAAAQDLEMRQMDFDNAFLNAELSHDVYMELPKGSHYPRRNRHQAEEVSVRTEASWSRLARGDPRPASQPWIRAFGV